MKKGTLAITKKATAYWKKEVKNGTLIVANRNDVIYVINGHNAFMFPSLKELYAELVQPATMTEMPENCDNYEFRNGIFTRNNPKNEEFIEDVVKMFFTNGNTATYTGFKNQYSKDTIVDIFSLKDGGISLVNSKFIEMIDTERVFCFEQENSLKPMVVHFDTPNIKALLLPMRDTDTSRKLKELAQKLF